MKETQKGSKSYIYILKKTKKKNIFILVDSPISVLYLETIEYEDSIEQFKKSDITFCELSLNTGVPQFLR